jgi:hypothetical protein
MISKYLYRKFPVLAVFSCLILLAFPSIGAADSSTGGIMGFVYGEDGKSPLQNAVVLLRGLNTQKLYQSEPTGETGAYKIPAIGEGTYVVGLKVNEEMFNTSNYISVTKGKTDTLSLSLQPPAPPPPESPPPPGNKGKKKPFFKKPVGIATIVAGTSIVGFGLFKLLEKNEEDEASPTQR